MKIQKFKKFIRENKYIDDILDKISSHGMNSLNSREKEYLKMSSKGDSVELGIKIIIVESKRGRLVFDFVSDGDHEKFTKSIGINCNEDLPRLTQINKYDKILMEGVKYTLNDKSLDTLIKKNRIECVSRYPEKDKSGDAFRSISKSFGIRTDLGYKIDMSGLNIDLFI